MRLKYLLIGIILASALSVGAATILFPNQGGTGWGSLQSNAVLLGNGTDRIATTTSGTAGQVLMLSGGVPTWSATSTLFSVDAVGHVYSASSTVSFSSCGTSPTQLSGGDQNGKIVIGTGVVSSCIMTFSNPFLVAPACHANDETAILVVRTVTTASNITFSVATTFNGDTISYTCSASR